MTISAGAIKVPAIRIGEGLHRVLSILAARKGKRIGALACELLGGLFEVRTVAAHEGIDLDGSAEGDLPEEFMESLEATIKAIGGDPALGEQVENAVDEFFREHPSLVRTAFAEAVATTHVFERLKMGRGERKLMQAVA